MILIESAESPPVLVLAGKANETEKMPFGPFREAVHNYVSRGSKELAEVQQAAGDSAPCPRGIRDRR